MEKDCANTKSRTRRCHGGFGTSSTQTHTCTVCGYTHAHTNKRAELNHMFCMCWTAGYNQPASMNVPTTVPIGSWRYYFLSIG